MPERQRRQPGGLSFTTHPRAWQRLPLPRGGFKPLSNRHHTTHSGVGSLMNILGINAFHGDASAALLADGNLVSAVEEERLNGVKHWAGVPALASEACLKGADSQELKHVAISRDPRAQLWRKLLRVATRPGDWSRLRDRASNSWRVA